MEVEAKVVARGKIGEPVVTNPDPAPCSSTTASIIGWDERSRSRSAHLLSKRAFSDVQPGTSRFRSVFGEVLVKGCCPPV
jgi:hypothetical protein